MLQNMSREKQVCTDVVETLSTGIFIVVFPGGKGLAIA